MSIQMQAQRGLEPRALECVVSYVDERAGHEIDLAALAAIARMSRFHFARLFQRSMGISPMAYVLRRRIELAMAALAASTGSLAQVAADLGFCDQSHFNRSFRKATGMTPLTFRREQAARLKQSA